MKKKAIAIGCHPDDIEFMMVGTLINLRDAGYEIHYINVANGSCGTNRHDRETIIGIRREESIAATKLIGATYHESLADDIEVLYELKTLRGLTAVVREVAPEIILTHYPYEYMEDHSNTCRLAVSAAFCRGMVPFYSTPEQKVTEQDVTVYHTIPYGLCDQLRRKVKGEIYVDVSETIETKKAMLSCHKSQKQWLDDSQGMDSYLVNMTDMCASIAKLYGNFKFAEAWIRHNYRGFCAPNADPLTAALGAKAVIDPSFEASLG
ncbi:MAG: hypothetical protein A2020_04230 [Lentisphaerae bacterium GWF2_45_14]|nr:MAG: hypothetical protein A2020_04230 [Lentisphaerae bacterium GWF2_45_14]